MLTFVCTIKEINYFRFVFSSATKTPVGGVSVLPPLGIGAAPLLLGNKSGQGKNTSAHGGIFLSNFENQGISLACGYIICLYSLVSVPGDSMFLCLSIDELLLPHILVVLLALLHFML